MSAADLRFKTVEQESDFWDGQELTEHMTGPQIRITARHAAKGVLPIRLPEKQLREVQQLARERRIGVGRLLSGWISERLRQEGGSAT